MYHRQTAANYAMRWALSRNPKFPNYSFAAPNPGGGGDCTNFISQCLLAGGWPMVEGGFGQWNWAWWANSEDSSRCWSSARWFGDYIYDYGKAKICARSDLDLGDLVTIYNGDHVMHVMIITAMRSGVDGDELLYCGHSTDRLNYPLAIAEDDYKGHDIFYWKVQSFWGGPGWHDYSTDP